MDVLISRHDLKGTFVYMDNITVCELTQMEHDTNLKRFYALVKQYNLTLDHSKSIISVQEINTLGFLISYEVVKPDPDRMKPLVDLRVPRNSASLKRALDLFSYYSKWVEKFSDKIRVLTDNPSFPLEAEAVATFNCIKKSIFSDATSSEMNFLSGSLYLRDLQASGEQSLVRL